MKHSYTCRGCGETRTTDQGFQARRGGPCRPCIRVANGWTCGSCGSADPQHPSPCPTA